MTKQDYNYIMAYKNRPYSRYFNHYFKTVSADKVSAYNDIARRPDVCTTPDIVSCSRFFFTTVYTSDRGEFVIDTVSYTHRYTLEDLAKYEHRLWQKELKKVQQTTAEIKAIRQTLYNDAVEYINNKYPDGFEYFAPEVFAFIADCFDLPMDVYYNQLDKWSQLYHNLVYQYIDQMERESFLNYNADNESWTQLMDAIL